MEFEAYVSGECLSAKLVSEGISFGCAIQGTAYNGEREAVRELRNQDKSCEVIAEELGISVAAVKDYCRVLGLPEEGSVHLTLSIDIEEMLTKERKGLRADRLCPMCGDPVIQPRRGPLKRFCSATCRDGWRYHHRKGQSKTVRTVTCACCGKEFTAEWEYNRKRKYCSLDCYYNARYGNETKRDAEGVKENEIRNDWCVCDV